MHHTTAEIASLFRVTVKAVHAWTREGMPAAKPGRPGHGGGAEYDLEQVVSWYFARNFERLELDRARTRLASEQAERTRAQNEARRAELAELPLIAQVVRQLQKQAQRELGAVGRRVSRRLEGLNGAERASVIDAAIRERLEELAVYRPQRPGR